MIGNDVVDLNLAKLQSNWQRPRFLLKLFSEQERALIYSAENKTHMVWRLWSMKEAAYKAHQRYFNLFPKFNPMAFECTSLSSSKGTVAIDNSTYETQTEIKTGYIYSETIIAKSNLKTIRIFRNISSSKELKKILLQEFSQQLGHPVSAFRIEKCQHQIPRVYLNNSEKNIAFSLTHHGKYAAFVMTI